MSQLSTLQSQKDALIQLLISTKAFLYNEETPFTLSSGGLSNYYIDCRKATLHPSGMHLIATMTTEILKDVHFEAVGGLTMGADPIATAVAFYYQMELLRTGGPGKVVKAFIVRKAQKDHGTKKSIEGPVVPGEHAVIVDDVVTTGASTITAIEKAREFGLIVEHAIVVVDRQENDGMANIEKVGVKACALLTRDEIVSVYKSGAIY